MQRSLNAAEQVAAEGIDVEVIDPRTLVPLDKQTIIVLAAMAIADQLFRMRDGVEVVKGLAAGDQVVSAGHNKLRNGQAVKIDNSIALPAVTGP